MNDTLTILIGLGAFLSSLLGCIQSININRRRFKAAAFTSVGIALCQLTLFKQVPLVSHPFQGLVFVVCGVCGAQLSMLVALRSRENNSK
jgi:predicted MFS family arabinose efflux permease